MDLVCNWCEASGFPYRHDRIHDVDKYVIQFDIGPKWDIFFGKFIQTIGRQFKHKHLETETVGNTAVINITDGLV